MRFIEEKEIKSPETVSENETAEAVNETASEPDVSEKEKRPLLQVPVIISLCLVVASLLGYFAYKIFWIAEPEGVIWKYVAEDDNDDEEDDEVWYFEFKDDHIFKAYIGSSFELTAKYSKEKSDNGVNTLTLLPKSINQSLGCFLFGTDTEYTISGSRLSGNQQMDISYTDYSQYLTTGKGEKKSFTLTQTKERETDLEPDSDFVEDEKLTGEWINKYSTSDESQSFCFDDDGRMDIITKYKYSNDMEVELCYHCTYLVDDDHISITMNIKGTKTELYDFKIDGDILYLDDLIFYREGTDPDAATADQIQ